MLCWVCIPQAEEEHLSCAMKFTCPEYSALIFYTSKLVQLICSLLMNLVMLEQLH